MYYDFLVCLIFCVSVVNYVCRDCLCLYSLVTGVAFTLCPVGTGLRRFDVCVSDDVLMSGSVDCVLLCIFVYWFFAGPFTCLFFFFF